MIYFELISLCCELRIGWSSLSFKCIASQLIWHNLMKRHYFFVHWTAFAPLSKINCLYTCGTIPIRLSTFMLMWRCFDYCNFMIFLISGNASPPTLFFFSSCLHSSRSFEFHMDFRMLISTKKPVGHLIGTELNLQINVGKILSLPIHEKDISLYLFRSSLSLSAKLA